MMMNKTLEFSSPSANVNLRYFDMSDEFSGNKTIVVEELKQLKDT